MPINKNLIFATLNPSSLVLTGQSDINEGTFYSKNDVNIMIDNTIYLKIDTIKIKLWRKTGPPRLTISPQFYIRNVAGIPMRIPELKLPGSTPKLIYADIIFLNETGNAIGGGEFKKIIWLGSPCLQSEETFIWKDVDLNNQQFGAISLVKAIRMSFYQGNIATC